MEAASMGLKRNLLAGWSGSVVNALVGLVMVPVYLHFLGAEAYGVIGLLITLQSLVQVFDLGLSATMNREMARGAALREAGEAVCLAAALERIYAAMAAAIALGLGLLAPLIAARWLNVQILPLDLVAAAIALIGAVLAVRWPAGLYQAVLLGADRAATASAINAGMTAATALGAAAVLCWRADLRWLLAWQLVAGAVQLSWLRAAAWRCLGPRPAATPGLAILRRQWKFSAAVAAINVIGLWFMQFDKVALSRLLPLALFSHYVIAAQVVSALYQLAMPVFNVAYPRFTALHALAREDELQRAYGLFTRGVAAVVFPIAMWLAVWGQGLVQLWTGSAAIAADAAPVLALLAAGSGLHAVMFIVYALQLARGEARLALWISIALLLVQAPLVWLATLRWGGIGAAGAWLGLHVVYLLFGGWATNRRIRPGLAWHWLARDVGPPLALAAAGGAISWMLLRDLGPQSWRSVLLGALFAGTLVLCGLLSSADLRVRTLALLRRVPALR
jgi:O-antigen/teichoic acid export membrane protein